jgi:hypothetical protein
LAFQIVVIGIMGRARFQRGGTPQVRREESVMFARVITAKAGTDGFDGVIRLAQEQLPGARQLPGFKGYYVLTDAGTVFSDHTS